ncbi:hypothetical protein HDF16_002721 [Granulicella aggregans]|uniref:VWFA-related protein n=1 Tax=Granulicella aggregans TaxID=474949 RepID=A0A7W7ZDP3_9BACT|nr:hypothetical protein [Granulicella aggregans]MBB5058015.1 hypothetical protein [Granulicella aggregans]
MMKVLVLAVTLALSAGVAIAQVEGPRQTDALVGVSAKGDQIPAISDIRIKVNGKEEKLTGWSQVPASGVQVAILIDEGLRQSIGTELNSLQAFTKELPEGAQIYVGYMRNGTVFTAQSFTTDHGAAAASFRLPLGSPGISGSPYFCLSEFVKHWPADGSRPGARFVLMVTNGVDPYNGSTSILNQDSPYVEAAIRDAQRAGVAVSSIYFGNAGFRGERASFSGQSYLTQVADGTGGHALYQGTGNPVSLAPLLSEFRKTISETYVASFVISGSDKKLQRVQAETSLHKVKLSAPQSVRPGNLEGISAE